MSDDVTPEAPAEKVPEVSESSEAKRRGPSQATTLVRLAKDHYRFLLSNDGRPYGVRLDGPNVALPLRGQAGLRSQLAKRYTEDNGGSVPSQSALADALTVLEGYAADQDPEPVHLRLARHGRAVVLDLGAADGRCVVVRPSGWRLEERSPVLFRRTNLTSPIPEPVRDGGGLARLRKLLNVSDSGFRLLIGWLLAALIPEIPHPILALKGEQGTAKSTAARFIVGLIDPSPAPLRTAPRDIKQWSVTAAASWTVCLDNVSTIPPWLSDTLCKAVTGDGIVDRALYTNDDVTVLAFRRVLAMTTIDAGALAGDLAERLLVLELEAIKKSQRQSDAEVSAAYEAARPVALGSLLDLFADVLERLPAVQLVELPRMADFARVLKALDDATGWTTSTDYMSTAENVAADVLEGDLFAQAVRELLGAEGQWRGSASELLAAVTLTDKPPAGWPKDATRASGQLKRITPPLRAVGIEVTEERSTGKDRKRIITIKRVPDILEIPRIPASAASAASTMASEQLKLADAGTDANRLSDAASVRTGWPSGAADAEPDAGHAVASGNSQASDLPIWESADTADAADAQRPLLSGGASCPECGQTPASGAWAACATCGTQTHRYGPGNHGSRCPACRAEAAA